MPRTRKAYADALFDTLPKDSPLRAMDKHYFCDAYLPEGVDNHGIRVNNPAEILNSMLRHARQEDSMLRAMMSVETLLAARQSALENKVKAEKLKLAPAGHPLTHPLTRTYTLAAQCPCTEPGASNTVLRSDGGASTWSRRV